MRFSKRIHAILMICSLMNNFFIILIHSLNKHLSLHLPDNPLTNMNPKISSTNYRSSSFKTTTTGIKKINFKMKKYSPMMINLIQRIRSVPQAAITKTIMTLLVQPLKYMLTKITSNNLARVLGFSA